MVVAARSVNVAVLELFGRRGANLDNLDLEAQVQSGKRVICIELNLVTFDADDRDDSCTFGTIRLELHARLDVRTFRELRARYFLHHLVVALTVSIAGSDAHLELVATRLALELQFEPWDQVAYSVKIGKGLAALGGVDDFAVITGELVFNGSDCVLGDLHSAKYLTPNRSFPVLSPILLA